jgi:hypothetical protein
MKMSLAVEGLRSDIIAVAELGDDVVAEVAERIAALLTRSASSRILDLLSDVAAELSSRITLRLSDRLKARVEESAARDGISVNGWILRTLDRGTSPSNVRKSHGGSSLRGYGIS